MNPRVADGLAIVIAVGWIVSVVADIAVRDYSPSPFVYMTMAGLASAVFGKRFVDGFRQGGFAAPPPSQRDDAPGLSSSAIRRGIRDERSEGAAAMRRAIQEQQERERRGR